MAYIKFASVKLMINYILLLCLLLLSSSETSLAKQKFAVQIAASKTQQNIQDLSKKYEIADSIYIIRSELWYRYLIGNFDDFEVASDYARKLVQKTKLKNVFVQLIDIETDHSNEIVRIDSSNHVSNVSGKSDDTIAFSQNSKTATNNDLINSNAKKTKPVNWGIGNYLLNTVFDKSKVKALQNSLIDYGNNRLPQGIRGFYISLIEKAFRYPVVLIFLVLIIFFILNLIAVFLLLDYTVRQKNQKERYITIYGKIYEETLLLYIFGEIDWDRAYLKLKRKNRKANRKILISILMNFHENLRGEMDKFIPEIFTKLGLHKDSIKATNSFFNYRKVQGIRELTNLYSAGALKVIPDLINDSNDNVRAEAQTAFIKLNPDDPFKFFQTLTKPFTYWTQLSAFNLIRVHQLQIPSFADFLHSKHSYIQNFSLRMIIYFQQLENIAEILKMLESKIDQTRFLSYKAINDLRLYEGKELIKNKFQNETNKNKLEIVKAFRNIGNLKDFDFLERIIESETVSLKVEACRSIYYMNNEGRERLLKLRNESIPELELYIAHVTDSRN